MSACSDSVVMNGEPAPRAALSVKIHRDDTTIALPVYATAQAAGMDLRSTEKVVIAPGALYAVATGLHIELPDGYEAQVRPRSGLAVRHGVTVLNTPGTIDADYRGEIKAILINLGKEPFTVEPGDRIAQMVIAPVMRVKWIEADELARSERQNGGFGSTGCK